MLACFAIVNLIKSHSYPVDQVDQPCVGARGAVPRVVRGLVLRGELAVGAEREAILVENSRAFVAAGEVARFGAGAANTTYRRRPTNKEKHTHATTGF